MPPSSPRKVFDRVGHWIAGDDPARREIAVAAHTQRRYAPRQPLGYRTAAVEDTRIHCVEYGGAGVVLVAPAAGSDVVTVGERVCRAAKHLRDRDPDTQCRRHGSVLPVARDARKRDSLSSSA